MQGISRIRASSGRRTSSREGQGGSTRTPNKLGSARLSPQSDGRCPVVGSSGLPLMLGPHRAGGGAATPTALASPTTLHRTVAVTSLRSRRCPSRSATPGHDSPRTGGMYDRAEPPTAATFAGSHSSGGHHPILGLTHKSGRRMVQRSLSPAGPQYVSDRGCLSPAASPTLCGRRIVERSPSPSECSPCVPMRFLSCPPTAGSVKLRQHIVVGRHAGVVRRESLGGSCGTTVGRRPEVLGSSAPATGVEPKPQLSAVSVPSSALVSESHPTCPELSDVPLVICRMSPAVVPRVVGGSVFEFQQQFACPRRSTPVCSPPCPSIGSRASPEDARIPSRNTGSVSPPDNGAPWMTDGSVRPVTVSLVGSQCARGRPLRSRSTSPADTPVSGGCESAGSRASSRDSRFVGRSMVRSGHVVVGTMDSVVTFRATPVASPQPSTHCFHEKGTSSISGMQMVGSTVPTIRPPPTDSLPIACYAIADGGTSSPGFGKHTLVENGTQTVGPCWSSLGPQEYTVVADAHVHAEKGLGTVIVGSGRSSPIASPDSPLLPCRRTPSPPGSTLRARGRAIAVSVPATTGRTTCGQGVIKSSYDGAGSPLSEPLTSSTPGDESSSLGAAANICSSAAEAAGPAGGTSPLAGSWSLQTEHDGTGSETQLPPTESQVSCDSASTSSRSADFNSFLVEFCLPGLPGGALLRAGLRGDIFGEVEEHSFRADALSGQALEAASAVAPGSFEVFKGNGRREDPV